MRHCHLLVCAVVVSCLAGSAVEAAAGRTAGSFNVSSVGSATYSIPVTVPPGPRGLQPRLALVYNSRSGNGPLGAGWSLAGLSGITRCNRTVAQDAVASSVALAYGDAFCLDGKRLRITSGAGLGSYGQDGTTYQTEIADFSNVTAHGVTGNGPAYFTVQGRDGLTYEYGNGGNSQIRATGSPTASAWLLNSVTDRANNRMVIAYLSPSSTLTGTSVPATISWTPTSAGSSTYAYTMQLNYSASGPESSVVGYVAGTSVLNQNLLRDITITNATGATTRRYVLDYGTSPTSGRYELTQVKECADSASVDCLLPTTITYQNGQAGVSASTTTAVSGASSELAAHYDFNSDGYPDLLYLSGSTYSVAFGSSSGYGAAVSTGIRSGTLGPMGDLLGTGADGMVVNNGGTWWYYTWNAGSSGFVGASTGVAVSSPFTLLADTNGDGLPDLVSLQTTTANGDSHTHLLTRLNASTGGSLQFSGAVSDSEIYDCDNCSVQLYFPDQAGSGPLRAWDFNGDGRQDLALRVQSIVNQQFTRRFYELLSTGTAFTASLISGPTSNDPAAPYVVNWNNDACSDVLWNQRLYISGCNGAAATVMGVTGAFLSALDWNEDGRTDLLVANGGTVGVYLSTGTGVSALQTTSVPYAAACARSYFTADFDADGLDDLGCWSQTAGAPVFYHLHNTPGQAADLVASITDGYGVRVSPTYTTTSRGGYARGQEATYPEESIHTPLNVVDQVSASDGIGGTFSQTFTYAGARRNVQGRGFEGFQSQTVRDSRANALLRVTTYQTAFPFTGMPIAIDTFQHDGATVVSHASYDNRKTDLDTMVGNQRAFVFTQSDTTQSYEVGGVKNGQLIHTAATTRTYDTVGNATRVQTTLTDNDTGSPYVGGQWSTLAAATYAPDTGSRWCLTQPTQSAITRTAPGVAAISQTTQFTPDFANCRESQRVTEPGSPTYSVAQSLSYDSFGNVSGTTVTGVGMAPRTTTLNWGATGQFPIAVTNALSEVTQFGYDLDRGVRTSATDPNGITTSWQYDAFGRRTREIRPDGTATAWAYNDCAGAGGCLVGNHSLAVTTAVYNADGSLQTDGAAYFDPLDRPLASNARMLAGGAYSRNEVRYDNLGRVQQQAAPCAWAGVNVACAYWATNTYDALDRLTQIQRPVSAANGALQTTRIQYAGRATTTIDAQGKSTTQVMTVGGTLGRVQDHNGYAQSLNYDAFGSLLGVTDGFGNTLYSAAYDYGVRPFQRDVTDADLDLSSAAGEHRHYTYNALGELTGWSDAKGQSFSQTYDALSRPLVRTEPDLITSWTWGNSAAGHDIGQLRAVAAGSYSESFTFDNVARLSSRTITIPSDGAYRYDFAYSAATGLLDTLTYPASTSSYRLKVQHRYQNGTLQSLSDFNAPGTVFWTANATNPRGQVTQETLGNGAITQRAFDAVTGWAGALQTGLGGGAALQNESYLFDLAGNLTQRQNNNVGLTENFYYDDLYRLDHSTLGGAVNLAVTYDASGNISSRSDVAGGAGWAYDLSHRHAVTRAGNSNYTYAYDANGNARTRDGLSISWTSFNHPSAINGKNLYDGGNESVQFAYDQSHERWRTLYAGTGGAETTYLIGGLLEKVLRNGTTDYRHYIQAGNNTIAIYSRAAAGANTLRYIRGDHEGSLSGVLGSDGASYVKTSFTAFGNRRSACSWSGRPTSQNLVLLDGVTRHGYTWQTALGAMGLNDMNGRVQDAVTGRFLSPDPYVSDPAFTQSYNRYSYVNNNPLTYTDPTGFAQTPALLRPNDDPERSVTVIGARSYDPDFSSGNDFRAAIDRFLSGNSEQAALERFFNYRVRPVSSRAVHRLPPAIEIGPSPDVPFVPHEPGLVSSFIGVDDLLGTLQTAILDGLGCDSPTCQITASLLLAASNPAAARGGAAALADSALVCRGGTCAAKRFINGSGVSLDSTGRLLNVSVNSATGKALDDLAAGIPNSRIGVTTVGSVRAAGGDVVPSPSALNPHHCVLCGITPEQAEALFTPSILNPNR